jgi:hypothetical protein
VSSAAGAGGGVVAVPVVSCFRPPLAVSPSRRSTRDPPHEQLLVRLGAGGVSWWVSWSRGARFRQVLGLPGVLVLANVVVGC